MLKILQEVDRNTGMPICNQLSCPSMIAGPGVVHTWLDANKNSVRVPAPQYIAYVQRWIAGKVTDPAHFPTDTYSGPPPTSGSAQGLNQQTPDNWLGKACGFPSSFASDVRNIYRQMFRCYAHMYYAHWLDFWHLSAYKELNTCFIHFINVGRLFGLLTDKDVEPMGPLIEIWLEKGWLPRPSSSGSQMGAPSASSSRGPSRTGSSTGESQTIAGAQQSLSQGSLGAGNAGQMGPPSGAGAS